MRYDSRQPFTTNADLIVTRKFTFDGEVMTPGKRIPAGRIEPRLAAQLYDQRRVDIAPKKRRSPATAGKAKDARTPEKDALTKSTAKATTPPELVEGGHTVKQAGFGGFRVIAPDGSVTNHSFETHAEAVAKAAELDGGAQSKGESAA